MIDIRRPLVRGTFCAACWGRGSIMEPGPLGLVPVLCEACKGQRVMP